MTATETTDTEASPADGTSVVDPAPGRSVAAPRISWTASVVTGLLAGAGALGAGEVVGGFRADWQSPVVGVAEATVDRVPRAIKEFAIRTFGQNDKVALIIGILTFSVVFAAVLGIVGRRLPRVAAGGFVVFAAVGMWASQQAVGAPFTAILPSVVAGAAGVATLWFLQRLAPRRDRRTPADDEVTTPAPAGSSRRMFLMASAGVAVVAAALGAGGRALRSRFSATGSRDAVVLPTAVDPLAEAPAAVAAAIDGVSTFYTANDAFYRVDTAVDIPQVLAETWTLRIHGMVDKEVEISFDELLKRQFVEEDITLTCVSNTVGGGLTGTARWLGVPIRDLLDEAGIQAGANQIVGRSVDGYTCGFPVDSLDGRPALLAIGMNGEPLPIVHGFPARLIVAGLYGYVSATKWLTELEVTTFDAFDQYWVERGWDEEAPIKTMARIDTPRTLGKVAAGNAMIGGVAWAQTMGITKVEVAIDDGDFVEAELADELNINTWRQWKLGWDAVPGRHRLTVRATDATGQVQTDQRADPFPNGASGWMSIFVDVQDAA